MTIKYLSVTDVSKRLGISTAAVSAYKLPQPDALIGRTRGWLPETIDQWNAQRPGRGVGGGRPRQASAVSPRSRSRPESSQKIKRGAPTKRPSEAVWLIFLQSSA